MVTTAKILYFEYLNVAKRLMGKAVAPHSSAVAWKNPMDGGAWWAAVHGVTISRT